MKPSPTTISIAAIFALLLAALLALPSCGNSSAKVITTGTGGTQGGTGGTGVSCTVFGATCTTNTQCCSGLCDPAAKTCTSSIGSCRGAGSACAVATDCCNLQCNGGVCASATTCTADNTACTDSSTCCSGNCTGGKCQALNTACLTAGNPCTATGPADGGVTAGGCCSGLCSGGTCVLGSSFCIQPGDVCARDLDCCGGFCSKTGSATLGVCMDVGASGVGNCTHDGTLCSDCGHCCSRNCGPWAQTGVNVCQPGLGCKIIASLCTSDSECCGSSTGQVTCEPTTGGTMSIGVCSTNTGNQVPGGICKLTGGNNSCSNAQSDCTCAVSPKIACCAFDTLGLPRCVGSGTCSGADGGTGVFVGTDPNCCRKPGDTCNTSSECCGLAPCVPDSTGTLRCLTPNDGGITCVKQGGACTATGDFCTGLVCNVAPGGSGICGPPPTPPPADAGACALYGQGCNANTPCCGTVQCTYSPTEMPCAAGQQGCTCFNPIMIGAVTP